MSSNAARKELSSWHLRKLRRQQVHAQRMCKLAPKIRQNCSVLHEIRHLCCGSAAKMHIFTEQVSSSDTRSRNFYSFTAWDNYGAFHWTWSQTQKANSTMKCTLVSVCWKGSDFQTNCRQLAWACWASCVHHCRWTPLSSKRKYQVLSNFFRRKYNLNSLCCIAQHCALCSVFMTVWILEVCFLQCQWRFFCCLDWEYI